MTMIFLDYHSLQPLYQVVWVTMFNWHIYIYTILFSQIPSTPIPWVSEEIYYTKTHQIKALYT